MEGVTETEISVVTPAELTAGVLVANDADRPARVATLSPATPDGDYGAIPGVRLIRV